MGTLNPTHSLIAHMVNLWVWLEQDPLWSLHISSSDVHAVASHSTKGELKC